MLINFQSPASADVVMFETVAREMLKLMGRRIEVPSAMYPEDVPAALSRLREAVASLPDDYVAAGELSDQDDDAEVPVSLQVRAGPLIDLLEASARTRSHVMWDFRSRS